MCSLFNVRVLDLINKSPQAAKQAVWDSSAFVDVVTLTAGKHMIYFCVLRPSHEGASLEKELPT